MTITELRQQRAVHRKAGRPVRAAGQGVIGKVLKNDAKKAFDIAAQAQFNLTPLRVVPTWRHQHLAVTLTTNGTATRPTTWRWARTTSRRSST
jgi:hypothetical protein